MSTATTALIGKAKENKKDTEIKKSLSKDLTCPECGTLNQEDAKHCKKCGTRLVERFDNCPQCGAELEPNSMFCRKCGKKLSQKTEDVETEESNWLEDQEEKGVNWLEDQEEKGFNWLKDQLNGKILGISSILVPVFGIFIAPFAIIQGLRHWKLGRAAKWETGLGVVGFGLWLSVILIS